MTSSCLLDTEVFLFFCCSLPHLLFPSCICFVLLFYCPLGPGTALYSNSPGHSNFDMTNDAHPLRYDSPMSPYASYYVYVPVSGVSTNHNPPNPNSSNNNNSNNNSNSNSSANSHNGNQNNYLQTIVEEEPRQSEPDDAECKQVANKNPRGSEDDENA